MRPRNLVFATTALLLAGAATLPLVRPAADIDFTAIPPEPAVVHGELAASKTTLAKAVEIAQAKTGGLVSKVEFVGGDGSAFHVETYGKDSRRELVVDAGTGEVKSNKEIPRFPGEPISGAWTETPSGLKYYEIRVGQGALPAGPTTKVKVHYSGWTVDGNQFDSSVQRGRPAEFFLNQVIKGWTEGVVSMKVGGKRKLIIHGDLGYGPRGNPGAGIPGNALLVFDVELLDILSQ